MTQPTSAGDDEYGLSAPLGLCSRDPRFHGTLMYNRGKIYVKSRPAPFFAFDVHNSVMGFDDSVYDGQAEARSLANALCGEERVENSAPDVVRDPRTIISD